jgi:hypothetical protein
MNRKLLTVAVMCATSLSSMMSTAALADNNPPLHSEPGAVIIDGMQDQCDNLAANHDTGNGDIWYGDIVLGAVTLVAGPTEVEGTRVIDLSSVVGIGPLHASDPYIAGAPFRVGGSVNLFGNQRASAAYYDDSTYNYTADFDSTYRHAFSCNIYHAVFHPESQQIGHYVIDPDANGNEENAILHECAAYNARGQHLPLPGYWGDSPHGNCIYIPGATVPESYDPPVLNGNEAGTPIDVDQTDLDVTAFEDHGGRFEVSGDLFIGQVVVCISPSNGPTAKKGVPGTWRPQNGYNGGDPVGPAAGCNTNYFNVAPWGSGSQTSNGTYISVPPAI